MKTKDEWLDVMELRLKRALLDVMDLSEDEGKLFLQQELRSHLEDVSGDRTRLDYLKSLKERFPQMSNAAEPGASVVETVQEETSVEVDVGQAMEIIRRDWEKLDETTRNEFIKEFVPEDKTPKSENDDQTFDEALLKKPSDELARFLKLSPEAPFSVERLQSVLVSLLKTVSQVDALGTQVYKQVGLSRDLSAEDIRKLVGEYVGGASVELNYLNQILDETRLKVGLIISSIADLPSNLSQSHLSKFQPSMIEQSVGGGGGFLANTEVKCWKKYIDLSEDIQPQKMEKAINDMIIKQLKKLKRR